MRGKGRVVDVEEAEAGGEEDSVAVIVSSLVGR